MKLESSDLKTELLRNLDSAKNTYSFIIEHWRSGRLKELFPIEQFLLPEDQGYKNLVRHTLIVMNNLLYYLELRSQKNAGCMILAAFLHDIGKKSVMKMTENGWSFVGHEEAGYELIKPYVKRLDLTEEQESLILDIVRYHKLTRKKDPTELMIKTKNWKELIAFYQADISTNNKLSFLKGKFKANKLRMRAYDISKNQ